MTDEQFHKLAATFGFAPSRALRELIDCATKQAVLAEREQRAKVCDAADKSTHPSDLADAIRARGVA